MRISVRQVRLALVCVLVLGGAPAVAIAQTVCTAAEVSAVETSCPDNDTPCTITRSHTVGDGCTLDFGTRDLLISPSGRLLARSTAMTLRAGSLNINTGGMIDGRAAAAQVTGGTVRIVVTGAVTIQGPNGQIDVSGDDGGGSILIEAGGPITVSGRLRAIGNVRFGAGGNIILRSEGAVATSVSSQVFATGAREGGVGGLIDVTARGRVDIGSLLDVDGSDGGEVNLYSAQDMTVRSVDASGSSDAGSGGCVGVQADGALQVLGPVRLNGTGSSQGSGGGCGGFVCFEARYGDLVIRDDVTAEGAVPDGGGGSIALIATAGSIMVQPAKRISTRGNGRQGCGGEICLDAAGSVDAQSLFDASGGLAGGDIDMSARKNITVAGGIDASGGGNGSCAGTMLLEAGFEAVGNVLVTSGINVSSGGCGDNLGCGIGGLAQIIGCRVAMTSAGNVNAQAALGGQIEVLARDVLQLQGELRATTIASDAQARDGSVDLSHPMGTAQMIGGVIRPLPRVTAVAPCTAERGVGCLVPCPACGNNVVEFPEGCDNGGGANPVSCDGCSTVCQLEDCDDGLNCTIDSCEPQRGCRHAPLELPSTPCYEPSEATPTSTRTVTPTRTGTATRTPTPSQTVTSVTATRTPTASPSASPPTPVAACVGDCDGSGRVSVDELVRGVNILLERQELAGCPSFDRNASLTVTVDELVAAVGIALGDGCP